MSKFEVIVTLGYVLITIALTFIVLVTFALSLHAENRWGSRFLPAIVPLIILSIAAKSLLSERDLAFAEKSIGHILNRSGGTPITVQIITLTILMIAMAKLMGTFVRRESLAASPGTPLYAALLIYLIASNFLPSVFGTVPAFVHATIYPVLAFSAAWAARRDPTNETITAAKVALYALMLGSLAAALIVPKIAVQPDYIGLIPGVKVRLWGLDNNPNSIGLLAFLTLLLEYLQPTRRVWLRAPLILCAATVLILAQSKTVWVALPMVLAILGWYRWVDGRGRQTQLVAALACIGVSSALLVLVMSVDVVAIWDHLSDSSEGAGLTTLTGRTSIWEVAFREWRRSLVFGYGPTIWDQKFRLEIGIPSASGAHNQVLQTLSTAGSLGFLALLVYLRYVIPAALNMASATRGVSLALLSMIFFRCFTEAPLSLGGLIGSEALTHFLLFVIILRAPHSEKTRRLPALAPANRRIGDHENKYEWSRDPSDGAQHQRNFPCQTERSCGNIR